MTLAIVRSRHPTPPTRLSAIDGLNSDVRRTGAARGSDPLEPGTMIAPGIALVRQLAEGGMGAVWEAQHEALGRRVAVKLMKSGQESFVQEAAALEQLHHPHVVRCFDFGTTPGGTPFLVMELLEGSTLASNVSLRGPLDLEATCRMVDQLADALSAAHERGLVHCDIKPANILLVGGAAAADKLDARMIDFGISKHTPALADDEPVARETAGTVRYMSPEQIHAPERLDARSDLWALAASAHFALTTRAPYGGQTPQEIANAVALGELPAPSGLRPEIPEEVDWWFQRALSADPKSRFATARELATALRRACGRPTSPLLPYPQALYSDLPRRETPAPRATEQPSRARMLLPLAVALALALALAIALAAP